MAESTASKTERVADFILDINQVSLHSADPGTTGASELTGGSPAYARKTPSWTAASAGASNLSASLTFDVATGLTAAYYGLWKSGTFYCGGALSASVTFTGQGTYVLTSIPISA